MTLRKEELTTGINKVLILGSGSLARKELLVSVGLSPFKIEIPGIDESFESNESPRNYVKRIAKEKANSINIDPRYFLVTADTIVTVGRRVLHKTTDEVTALRHLRSLSGRRHSVFTAFCIKHNGLVSLNLVKTSLKMRLLTEKEISTYIATREWIGCAGAYSIQGRAKGFFPFISGCFSNIIGLPIPKMMAVLTGLGFFEDKQ